MLEAVRRPVLETGTQRLWSKRGCAKSLSLGPNPKPNTGNPDSNPTLSGRLRLDILQLHKTEEPNYKPCIELYLAHPRPSRGIFLDTCAQNDPIIFRYSGLG